MRVPDVCCDRGLLFRLTGYAGAQAQRHGKLSYWKRETTKKIPVFQSFQAFATTVGGRVGTGNIAGTATAVFMGGPGALFWMWVTAILGASTGIVECILGQAYKTRNLGELTGGPAFYMSNGIKNKKLGRILAVLFCIAVFHRTGISASGDADTDGSNGDQTEHLEFRFIVVGIAHGCYRWSSNNGRNQTNRPGGRSIWHRSCAEFISIITIMQFLW